jgi:hypothetical protein
MDISTEKEKRKRSDPKLYRSPLYRVSALIFLVPVSVIAALALLLSLVFLFQAGLFFVCPVPFGLIFLFGAWGLYEVAFKNRLVVTEEGIFFHYMNVEDFVRWDEMTRFEMRPSGNSTLAGIVLNRTSSKSDRLNLLMNGGRFANFIDLTPFMLVLTSSPFDFSYIQNQPLIQDIYRYAPHLFNNEKTKRDG